MAMQGGANSAAAGPPHPLDNRAGKSSSGRRPDTSGQGRARPVGGRGRRGGLRLRGEAGWASSMAEPIHRLSEYLSRVSAKFDRIQGALGEPDRPNLGPPGR